MRKAKYLIYVGLFLLFLNGVNNTLVAQSSKAVTGVVTVSESGETLPGVNVLVKGTTIGTITDSVGHYTITPPSLSDTLVFSYVGFQRREITIEGRQTINVKMTSKSFEGEEMVVVGFGEQKKSSMVSSVTSIKPDQLKKGGTDNLTNMMAGRVSGMIAFQRSGEPGANNSNFFIRGLGSFGAGKVNPLILIDGVESTTTDMARLQPDDIESFSVLKDATASAVYGARGANGVVVIKTKSGINGKTKFSVRASTKISSNTQNFKMTDNITYMDLANQAALTRDPNAVLPYSHSKIAHTEAEDNPLMYPSNNWINQLIKDYTINQSYNVSARGGGDRAQYYVAGTYNIDNGVLKVNGINNFNNNIKLRNYSVRSNVNLNLTPSTEAIIRVYGQFDNYNGPIGGGAATFNRAIWSNPVKFPAVYPKSIKPWVQHPLFGGSATGRGSSTLLTNPYAEMVKGYQVWKRSNIQPQIVLDQDLKFVTPGLRFHAMGYLQRKSYFQVSRSYNPFYYSASLNPADQSVNLSVLNDGSTNSVGPTGTEYLGYNEGGKTLDSKLYLESRFNYDKTIADKHDISAMVIGRISDYESGNSGSVQSSLPQRNLGISGRFTYNYDSRYFGEVNFGYNGSERFANNHRYGFFPSVGVGYNISNEKYFQPLKDVITNLKLRATYGLIGNDQIGNIDDRFFYLSNVNLNDGIYGAQFGEQFDYYRSGVSISRYSNNNITWEKSKQMNLGLDLSLFDSFTFTADVYRQHRYNILQTRSYLGPSMGLMAIPSANTGEAQSEGIDLSAHYNTQISQNWWTTLRGNFTYAHSTILKYDEINYPDNMGYRSLVGQSINQRYGYIAERLFVDDEEVENSPAQFGDYMGGDIKYRDMNGDGVITTADQVPIGYPTTPEIVYGFGGSVGFKNIDFNFFFQGVARTSLFINAQNISPFVINGGAQNGLLRVVANDHWSQDDRDSYAFWPRLSNTFIENNNQSSTWWMRNGAFLRLKTVEFGYTLPKSFTEKHGIASARLYVNGTNLWAWSPFKLWDPEMGGNGLGYPIQSVFNFGIKLDL